MKYKVEKALVIAEKSEVKKTGIIDYISSEKGLLVRVFTIR
jgi:hypothetical protein